MMTFYIFSSFRQKAQDMTIKKMAATISNMANTISELTMQQQPRKQSYRQADDEPECNILIAGGHDGQEYLNSSEVFNFATRTWQIIGVMKEGRLAPSAFLYQNNVIVAGGFNGDTSTNRMEGK